MKKVVGIGNAVVDVFVEGSDAKIQEMGLTKGNMHLVDLERWQECSKVFPLIFTSPGGSVLNSLTTLAQLGLDCSVLAAIGKDAFGQTLQQHMNDLKIQIKDIPIFEKLPSARSLIIVTPDGERTMVTNLGASIRLGAGHVSMHTMLDSNMVMIEGYLVTQDQGFEAMVSVAEICSAQNLQSVITLGSENTVKSHLDKFKRVLGMGGTIIAGNLSEVNALYGTSAMAEAVEAGQKDGRLHIITNSEHGAVICDRENVVEIPTVPAKKVVDTTGAGDQYLAGFLMAYLKGADLASSGRFGSVLGSAIVEQISAIFHREIKDIFARATSK